MRLRVLLLGTPVLQITTGADVLEDARLTVEADRQARVADRADRDRGDLSTYVEPAPQPHEPRTGFTPQLP